MKNVWRFPAAVLRFIISIVLLGMVVIFAFACFIPESKSLDDYELQMLAVTLIIATFLNAIVDFNSVQSLKNTALKYKADVDAAIELRNSLLNKAERVADKYRNVEVDLYDKFADARTTGNSGRIKNSRDFKVVVESYPELKANIHTQKLFEQIEVAEGNLQTKRNNFTSAAANYNTIIHTFPTAVLRFIFRWKDIEMSTIIPNEDIVSDEELGI